MNKLYELTALANRSTFSRRRAEAMGFTFDRIEVDEFLGVYSVSCYFTCVCGKPERFVHLLNEGLHLLERELDVAARIEAHGSFSRSHLINDGFSAADVDEILRKRREYTE